MHFTTLVLKNVLRRRGRSLLTALGVALAVATFVALVGISTGLVDSIDERYNHMGIDLVVLKSGRAEQVYATIPERIEDSIAALPNVQAVCPILFDVVTFEDADLIGVFIEGWRHDSALFADLKVLSGEMLKPEDGRAVMLGKMLAENLKKKVGDSLDVDGQKYRVVAIIEAVNAIENGGAVMLLDQLQDLMDRQGQVTGFEVLLKDDNEAAVAAACRDIEALRNDKGKPWRMTATPVKEQADRFVFVKMGRAMAWLTSLIAVVIGCVGVLNTMMMSVFERTHEIGVLRAMGWRKSRVVRMIMLEALIVSLCGAVLGTLSAVALIRVLSIVPAANVIVDGRIASPIIVEGALLAVLVALLGGVYPAYRAAAQLPTLALRHD